MSGAKTSGRKLGAMRFQKGVCRFDSPAHRLGVTIVLVHSRIRPCFGTHGRSFGFCTHAVHLERTEILLQLVRSSCVLVIYAHVAIVRIFTGVAGCQSHGCRCAIRIAAASDVCSVASAVSHSTVFLEKTRSKVCGLCGA